MASLSTGPIPSALASPLVVCAISGEVPGVPVISKKSGHVFERHLLEKALAANGGRCPVTGESLSLIEDTIPLRVNPLSRPRPPSFTSFPSLLSALQNEWDALALESYTLKTQLESTRQELAHALYRFDAAQRVIARLIEERDQAFQHMKNTQKIAQDAVKQNFHPNANAMAEDGNINANPTPGAQAASAPAVSSSSSASSSSSSSSASSSSAAMEMEVESGSSAPPSGMTAEILAVFEKTARALSSQRRANLKRLQASVCDPTSFSITSSHTLHSTTHPGISVFHISPQNSSFIATGGFDGQIIIFDHQQKQIIETLEAHKKKITDLKFHPTANALFSASLDHTIHFWANTNATYRRTHTINTHSAPVIGLAVHPSGDYVLSADAAAKWSVHDVMGNTRTIVSGEKCTSYSKMSMHPDGLLLVTGSGDTDGKIEVWDIKNSKSVATLKSHDGSCITALEFSENGTQLASADDSGLVHIWDLRKVESLHSFQLQHNNAAVAVTSLRFDLSASFLAVCGGDEVQLYGSKQWKLFSNWSGMHPQVTQLDFHLQDTENRNFMVTAGKDRHLRIWS